MNGKTEESRAVKIEVKHRFTGIIILEGEYQSLKECLENNRGADLRGADLCGADLCGADLRDAYLRGADLCGADLGDAYLGGADLRGADLRGADLCGAYLRGADLRGADLCGADLDDADLDDADLRDAYLCGAYLRGADLGDAVHYQDSHDIFLEIVRRQKVSVFTDTEWAAIAQITIHRLCWDSILKRFGNVMGHIFEVLATAGFGEWLRYWQEIQHEKN